MNASDTNKSSRTNWDKVDALDDSTIDTSDIPPLTDSFFASAKLRVPASPVAVTLHVDSEVMSWFKDQGSSWEQRMNAALRLYVDAHKSAERDTAASIS